MTLRPAPRCDDVDAIDRLSLGDVGGTYVTLVGLAGHHVDTVLGADGAEIWIL